MPLGCKRVFWRSGSGWSLGDTEMAQERRMHLGCKRMLLCSEVRSLGCIEMAPEPGLPLGSKHMHPCSGWGWSSGDIEVAQGRGLPLG